MPQTLNQLLVRSALQHKMRLQGVMPSTGCGVQVVAGGVH